MTASTDMFNVPELYLLAAAFGGNVLFGLPDKQIYELQGEAVFKEAQEQLIEKEILTPGGRLTKIGVMVIQALEDYYKSEKYVRVNNLMFAFLKKNPDKLIILVELEQNSYQLRLISKAFVLKLLSDQFPLIGREPGAGEHDFLRRELDNEERREVENFEPDQSFMNLEVFHLNEQPMEATNPKFYEQWFIFLKDEKLIMTDVPRKKYYHASQYWFLKMLFDNLEFPYKEAK
ncbi:DUF5081 family protein [Caldifermentibacillus hisashii]|uniref:DUF5081 family protein n=1 Tax=Caldifermentibacillus hisashii TaxID=996558 RepID=A0ABU9K291_9BACI